MQRFQNCGVVEAGIDLVGIFLEVGQQGETQGQRLGGLQAQDDQGRETVETCLVRP